MKSLIWLIALFIALLAAMILGPSVAGDVGYVLFALGPYTAETSVVGLCFIIVIAYVGYLIARWVIRWLIGMLSGSHSWFGGWSQRRLNKAYFKGITAYFEGDLHRAEKWLSRTQAGDFDGVNLLALGQVAAELEQSEKALSIWQKAVDDTDATYAAKVCIAKHHLQNDQAEQALTILEGLEEKEQNRISIVNLWIQSLAQLGRWQDIQHRLPGWKKILGAEYEPWATRAAKGEFAEIASKSGANQLIQHWHQLPRGSRRDVAKQAAYVQQLLDQGMHNDAQKHLVEWQSSGPVEALLPLMKQLQLANPAPSTKLLEHWLKQDESNVEYLTILGAIALNCGNDILAEKALQKAIKLEPNQERLRLLAQISERKQDNVKALALYKQSVE